MELGVPKKKAEKSHNLTYEELKLKKPVIVEAYQVCHNLTYEELKQKIPAGFVHPQSRHNLTYEELKPKKAVAGG